MYIVARLSFQMYTSCLESHSLAERHDGNNRDKCHNRDDEAVGIHETSSSSSTIPQQLWRRLLQKCVDSHCVNSCVSETAILADPCSPTHNPWHSRHGARSAYRSPG